MTLDELVGLSLSKADEEPGDTIIDDVAKSGVNQGYMLLASSKVADLSKKTTIAYSANMTLPQDFVKVLSVYCGDIILSDNDYRLDGLNLKITNKTYGIAGKSFDIFHTYYPAKLVNATDVPLIKEGLQLLLTSYGAYMVLIYKKKYESASAHLKEFINALNGGGETNEVQRNR